MEELDYTKHKDDFMLYVWKNRKELEKCIRKNITYDKELFEEVFMTTLTKCGESILYKNTYVDDFKNYFFIAFKYNYIAAQNRKRNIQATQVNIEDAYNLPEEINDAPKFSYKEYCSLIEKVSDFLINRGFSNKEIGIFMLYNVSKMQKSGISYQKISSLTNIPVKQICKIIREIRVILKDNKYDIIEFDT